MPQLEKDTLIFWLRAECKGLEKRTPLIPEHAKQLIENGHVLFVEKSLQRCVSIEEYEKVGCNIVEEGSWIINAPKEAIILGLKELPENLTSITHHHVYFAHCYKNQLGWQDLLRKFIQGNGLLWDLEFLVDENGRRVAAFGRSAGFIGMALGIKQWCEQKLYNNKILGPLNSYPNSQILVNEVKEQLDKVYHQYKLKPKIFIMGALGRSGKGALDFLQRVGIGLEYVIQWDINETKKGGPFEEILESNIFVNCIYLSSPIPPFITKEMIQRSTNQLSVVVDISCDASSPYNPVAIYKQTTGFQSPTLRVSEYPLPVDVIAIDHLPSLVPLESSIEFSSALINHLIYCGKTDVWKRAENLFKEKIQNIS